MVILRAAEGPGPASAQRAKGTSEFREERQQLNSLDPETAEREKAAREPERVELARRGSRIVKRLMIGDCWYRTLDTDAGIRSYEGPRGSKRFWHGYYSGKAVNHFTGGVIPFVDSAGRQEWDLFEDHYDLVCQLLGRAPDRLSRTRACPSAMRSASAPRTGLLLCFPGELPAATTGAMTSSLTTATGAAL